jgi:hypothetical protein
MIPHRPYCLSPTSAIQPTTSSSQAFQAKQKDAGVVTSMAKEWIANLAHDIKQKSHEAAEQYGRSQHQAGIITTQGKPFFAAFVSCLEEDVAEIKRQLQGDVTASETIIQTTGLTEVKVTRSRFPWFDARITHHDPTITLDYARGLGVASDPAIDRKSRNFAFQVTDDDALYLQDAFDDNPKRFHQPEDLARHILQILFKL